MITNLIEKTGTGSIEHTGTGSIEHTGTGSIEHTGTGSIEHTGTGSIERTGTGSIARRIALAAAMSCVFMGTAISETASYETSHGTIDLHANGGEVRVSWHYDDGVSRQFLVGSGNVTADYSLIKLRSATSFKVTSDGTGKGSAYEPSPDNGAAERADTWEMGTPDSFLKVTSDGTGKGSSYKPNPGDSAAERADTLEMGAPESFLKVTSDGTGKASGSSINLELIFTPEGVEAVATLRNAHTEVQSMVFDLNNSGEFAEATVFLGTEVL